MEAIDIGARIGVDKEGRQIRYQAVSSKYRQALIDFYQAFEPKAGYQGLPPPKDLIGKWIDGLLAEWINLGAFHEDRLIGHAALDCHGGDSVSEYMIFVAPEFQNGGIGTALTRYATDTAQSARRNMIWLTVQNSNLRAIKVYRKAGFTFTGPFAEEREMILKLEEGVEEMRASFIYSPKFGQFVIHEGHPWYTTRSDACYRLCQRHLLFDQDWISVSEPKEADRKDLEDFHAPAYLDMLRLANANVFEESMLLSGIGITECPVFKGVYDYNALIVGASLLGADLIASGQATRVFSPTGGMHHAGPDFAAGFCYVNDAVLAMNRLLEKGLRLLYVDIDAHHGDQVQAAYYDDDRVLCLSFHEDPRTLFPFVTGFETELGEGKGRGYNVNVPLLAGTGDEVYLWAFKQIYPPIVKGFKPDVVIGVFGADTIFSDPMTNLLLTNNGITEAVEIISESASKLLAFGCGGYVLDNMSRAWTLAWAAMTKQELDLDQGLTLGGVFLGNEDVSLLDGPHFVAEKTLAETRVEAERIVSYLKREVPLLAG